MSNILITLSVLLILIAALHLLRQKQNESTRQQSHEEQLDGLIRQLMNSTKDGSFLIIGIQDSEDFLQMTSSSTGVQLDFPLITDRQKRLESKIRSTAADQNLMVKEQRGSDGSRFLDIDIHGEPNYIAAVCRRFMEQIYGASEPKFRYQHDGLSQQ